ncbi:MULTISPECIES: hypothetical protein [Corynebacterium]|uniref:hypothetical protein n=1 Tax=Corynebacterium TaxID=1716 RepID=UPI000665D1D7|nr:MULTISPECIES: hypothetical protein [unclassified Corynebacterium]AYX81904.1 hypothetical protein EGX79_06765 [Corynebacterium jeikeium]MBC6794100.1 hypothetical protein [Corynebacterium sp. LK26]MCG7268742.1 hypothetical protein [Corynebacterium amycolatum]OFL12542.1 hypothetical protein HMPREF2788_00500 [Corynebacterium sp. HMSC063F04]OFL71040.1 hypothetical protein HMPREF2751_04555 [Corynebacterium sp. HMSC063G05]
MATSKSSGTSSGGGFLNSPANIVGLILAIAVVLLHLTVGLGFLWPVVAIAAWGASVALLPRQSKGAQKSVSSAPKPEIPQRRPLNPSELRRNLHRTLGRLFDAQPGEALGNAANDLGATLESVLSEWKYLKDYPEQKVVIGGIIQEYLPQTVNSYLAVPERLRHKAENPARESIDLLHSAVQKIQDAIGQDNLIALEGQRDTLAIQFGKVVDYEP